MTNVYPAPATEESRSFGRILRLTNEASRHTAANHRLRAAFYNGRLVAAYKAHERAFGPIVKR